MRVIATTWLQIKLTVWEINICSKVLRTSVNTRVTPVTRSISDWMEGIGSCLNAHCWWLGPTLSISREGKSKLSQLFLFSKNSIFQIVNIWSELLCVVISKKAERRGIDYWHSLSAMNQNHKMDPRAQLRFSVRVSPGYSPANQLYHYGLSFNCWAHHWVLWCVVQ